jgi:hypothetical protein
MSTAEWERGYAAGYAAAHRTDVRELTKDRGESAPAPRKKTRKASAYSKKYGRAFKKIAPKYKNKKGGWKKDGFKRAQKAAHRMAKK